MLLPFEPKGGIVSHKRKQSKLIRPTYMNIGPSFLKLLRRTAMADCVHHSYNESIAVHGSRQGLLTDEPGPDAFITRL